MRVTATEFAFRGAREGDAFGPDVPHTFVSKCTRVLKMYFPEHFHTILLGSSSELSELGILNSGFGIVNHSEITQS